MMGLDKQDRFVTYKADGSKRFADSAFPSEPSGPPPIFTNGGNNNTGGPGDDPDPVSDACRLVLVNLSAYQDGELDSDTLIVVEAHIAKCDYCSAILDTMIETDEMVEREWREYSPLPSSFGVKHAVDNIMAQLPAVPDAPHEFAPKRVHARLRWMRFSTGVMSIVALFSMLWTSYRLGFAQGKEARGFRQQPTRFSPAHWTGSPVLPQSFPTSASIISRTVPNTSSALISRMHL